MGYPPRQIPKIYFVVFYFFAAHPPFVVYLFSHRRSKLEFWIEKQLKDLFPHLEGHFNRKDTINSELDIFFPSVKLAIEINGIFHYKPIFGEEKLKEIENNDRRKAQACLDQEIELITIDSSGMKNFKEQKAQKFLDIILEILNRKLLK